MNILLSVTFTTFAAVTAATSAANLFVPARDKRNVWNSKMGRIPHASVWQYCDAAAACAAGWPSATKMGCAVCITAPPSSDRNVAARTPCRKYVATAPASPAPCACDVRGSKLPTNPLVVIITSHVVIPPRLAAASAASPTWPTIRVSTIPMAISPSSTVNTASTSPTDPLSETSGRPAPPSLCLSGPAGARLAAIARGDTARCEWVGRATTDGLCPKTHALAPDELSPLA
mmetsp:Transcript_10518/g.38982  ORF Transcript_10518/g.38982 Transcript_10518/m.38982 type:complete len:231 (-) Transcript_10518:137-829(-)